MDIFLTVAWFFIGYLLLECLSFYISFPFFLVGKLLAFLSFPLNILDLYVYPVGNMVYITYYFGLFVLFFIFVYRLIIYLKRL